MKTGNTVIAFCLLLINCTTIVTGQTRSINSVIISSAPGVRKISLKGTWQFTAAISDLMPESSAPEAVDAKAKEIVGNLAGKGT